MFKIFKSSEYLNFMGIHKICFIVSLCAILLSVASFFVNKLTFGVDFTGGLLFDISVKDNRNIADLRSNFLKNNFKDFNIQSYGDNGFIIRMSTKEIAGDSAEDTNHTESIKMIKNVINSFFNGDVVYNKVDFVGPQIGNELIIKGSIALALSLIVIMIYIWVRFEFEFGLGAFLTLFHDTIIIFGIYSLFGIEFDLTSIAAVLTIIGYSINDTVVIYDRIREFLPKYKKEGTIAVINRSLTTTLRRTLLTSSTTLLSLLVLVIFGGESIKNFSLMVFLGIIIGTYSSIYISAPILLYVGVNSKKLK